MNGLIERLVEMREKFEFYKNNPILEEEKNYWSYCIENIDQAISYLNKIN